MSYTFGNHKVIGISDHYIQIPCEGCGKLSRWMVWLRDDKPVSIYFFCDRCGHRGETLKITEVPNESRFGW
jgi:hypothetical protein